MSNIYKFSDVRPHQVVCAGKHVHVVCVDEIRRIATGQTSIAEYENPEDLAMVIAKIAIEAIDK